MVVTSIRIKLFLITISNLIHHTYVHYGYISNKIEYSKPIYQNTNIKSESSNKLQSRFDWDLSYVIGIFSYILSCLELFLQEYDGDDD